MFFNKKKDGTSDLEEKDEDKGSSTGAKKNLATKQTSEPPKDSNKQDDKPRRKRWKKGCPIRNNQKQTNLGRNLQSREKIS